MNNRIVVTTALALIVVCLAVLYLSQYLFQVDGDARPDPGTPAASGDPARELRQSTNERRLLVSIDTTKDARFVQLIAVDPDGRAVPRAAVTIARWAESGRGSDWPTRCAYEQPIRDWRLVGMTDELGILSFEPPQDSFDPQRMTLLRLAATAFAVAQVPLRREAGSVRVVLSRSALVSVHVVDARNGNPLRGARVRRARERRLPRLGAAIRATSDDNGVARLVGLSAGQHRIEVEAEGYAYGETVVVVRRGQRRRIRVALSPTAWLHVRVRAKGRPSAAAHVLVHDTLEPQRRTRRVERRTDDDGVAHFGSLSGRYPRVRVEAWADGYQRTSTRVDLLEEADSYVDLQLAPTAAIEIRILGAATRETPVDVELKTFQLGGSSWQTRLSNLAGGAVRTVKGVPTGRDVFVQAFSCGVAVDGKKVRALPGEKLSLTLNVPSQPRVLFRVHGVPEDVSHPVLLLRRRKVTPVWGISMESKLGFSRRPVYPQYHVPLEGGRAVLSVVPGSYRAWLKFGQERIALAESVEIHGNEEVELRLPRLSAFAGILVDEAARPLSGRLLLLNAAEGDLTTLTGPDGRFRFPAVEASRRPNLHTFCEFGGHYLLEKGVHIERTGRTFVYPSRTIHGRVVDLDSGAPVQSPVRVTFLPGTHGFYEGVDYRARKTIVVNEVGEFQVDLHPAHWLLSAATGAKRSANHYVHPDRRTSIVLYVYREGGKVSIRDSADHRFRMGEKGRMRIEYDDSAFVWEGDVAWPGGTLSLGRFPVGRARYEIHLGGELLQKGAFELGPGAEQTIEIGAK